jgi:hypothetical protein
VKLEASPALSKERSLEFGIFILEFYPVVEFGILKIGI